MPPRPYTVMPKQPSMLSSIIATSGVEVTPPAGVGAALGVPLAEALSAALQEQDIPSVTQKPLAGGHRITGAARLEANSIIVLWLLQNPAGETLSRFEARGAVAPHRKAETPLDPGVAQALATRTAAAFAPYFLAQHGLQGASLKVAVPDLVNVAGDGGRSLPLALRRALSAAGLQVVAEQTPQTVRISGQVHLSDLDAASQLVALTWRVTAADGSEIGVVEQSNPVPRGRLEGNWGEMAYAAAAGAAEGILPLLQDYQAKLASEGLQKS